MINLDDIPDAIRELERAAHLGLAGAMITEYPFEHRRYDQSEYETFWAAAAALDLPLSLHTATRRQGKIRGVGNMTLRDASSRATKAFYLLAERGIKHKRTRPYTPRTNGKAERFIQTSLREWAYAQPFHSSADRAAAMPLWIDTYNRSRPHSALRAISPLSWIATQTAASPTTPPATLDAGCHDANTIGERRGQPPWQRHLARRCDCDPARRE